MGDDVKHKVVREDPLVTSRVLSFSDHLRSTSYNFLSSKQTLSVVCVVHVLTVWVRPIRTIIDLVARRTSLHFVASPTAGVQLLGCNLTKSERNQKVRGIKARSLEEHVVLKIVVRVIGR